MNLLKVLFGSTEEETAFFENVPPLTDDLFGLSDPFQGNAFEPVAIVCAAIHPGRLGHVKFRGVRWRASSDRPVVIPVGTAVRVLGRQSNILIVEPVTTSALTR